jgi:hypothetical protein
MPVRSVAVCEVKLDLNIADIQDGGDRSIEATHFYATHPPLSPPSPPPIPSLAEKQLRLQKLPHPRSAYGIISNANAHSPRPASITQHGFCGCMKTCAAFPDNSQECLASFLSRFSKVPVIRRNHVHMRHYPTQRTHYITQTHSQDNHNDLETPYDTACTQHSHPRNHRPTRHLVCGRGQSSFREQETTRKLRHPYSSSSEVSH